MGERLVQSCATGLGTHRDIQQLQSSRDLSARCLKCSGITLCIKHEITSSSFRAG